MRSPAPPHSRILLCASAAHCAQVLHAAAAARVNLHGLQVHTQWPSHAATPSLLLWALLPSSGFTLHAAQELQWRSEVQNAASALTIHMLYGNAVQQAAQLAPWVQHVATGDNHAGTGCGECLDAGSEQKLFQHLLQKNRSTQ